MIFFHIKKNISYTLRNINKNAMRVVFQIIFCQSGIKTNASGFVSGSFIKIIVFTGSVCPGGQACVIAPIYANQDSQRWDTGIQYRSNE